MNIVIGAIISSFVVIFTSKMNIVFFGDSNSYRAGAKKFIGNYMIFFLLRSILSSYFLESSVSVCIAEKIISKLGTASSISMLVILYSISVLLTYGGISIFYSIPLSFS